MAEHYTNMTMNDKECLICQKPRQSPGEDEGEITQIQNKMVYLCAEHFDSFTIGRGLGQHELNTKVIQKLCNLDDKATGFEVKKTVYDLIPLAKRQIQEHKRLSKMPVYSPKEICEHLDAHVVGQDDAKMRISLSVFEHLKQLRDNSVGNIAADKHNVLLVGPSGSGKTLLAHTVSQYIELPFTSADATSFSPTGYQGADADSTVADLFFKSSGVITTAEKGCIFFDEIDKLATSRGEESGRSDAFNLSTQNSLLRLIEGKRVKVPVNNVGDAVHISTDKVLFFFGGAVPGLVDVVAKLEGHSRRQIGFRGSASNEKIEAAKENYDIISKASPDILMQSLIDYGLSTEFVGRIPVIVPLAPLSKEQLAEFLLDISHSPIVRQKELFAESGYEIEFTDEYIEALIEKAYKMVTGARALTSAVKTSVSAAGFDLLTGPTRKKNGRIIITPACLTNPQEYNFVPRIHKVVTDSVTKTVEIVG